MLDQTQKAILKARAVHGPVTEMKLSDGIAPVPHLLEAGVNVALGTEQQKKLLRWRRLMEQKR